MTKSPIDDGAAWRHPEESQLLAYLDGELTPDLAADAGAHLDRCWLCRSRLSQLRASIDTFLSAREGLLPDDVGPPRSDALRRRLAEQRRQSAPERQRPTPPAWQRLSSAMARVGRLLFEPTAIRLVTCGAAMIVLLVLLNVSVSASRVLEQAAAVERAQVEESDRVAHAVLAFDRVEADGVPRRLASLDTADDAATARRRIVVRRADDGGERRQMVAPKAEATASTPLFAGAVDPRVLGYLDRQRWVPSLSIAEYRKLIAGRGTAEESGRRTWDNLFELRHAFAQGHASRLVESRIWLDRGTYQPTRMSLFFDDGGRRVEYRLTRVLFEQVPRTAAWARLFTEVEPAAPQAMLSAAAAPALPGDDGPVKEALPASDEPLAWSDAPATDVEAAAAVTLHRLRADRGEEIHLFAIPGHRALVQGVVRDAARRQALMDALAGDPGVRVDLRTDTARHDGPPLHPAPWVLHPAPWMTASEAIGLIRAYARREADVPPAADASAAGAPADAAAPAVSVPAEDSLALSTALLVEAWAWQRLDVQFGASRASALSPAAIASIEAVKRDHRLAVARAAALLRARLSRDPERGPIAAAPAAATSAPAAGVAASAGQTADRTATAGLAVDRPGGRAGDYAVDRAVEQTVDRVADRSDRAGRSVEQASERPADLSIDVIVGLAVEQCVLLRDWQRTRAAAQASDADAAVPARLHVVLEALSRLAGDS